MTVLEEMLDKFEKEKKIYERLVADKKFAPTDSEYHKDVRKRYGQAARILGRLILFLKTISRKHEEKSLAELFSDLEYWSEKYEFSFQFWGEDKNNLFISKGGVQIYDTGSFHSPKDAVLVAIQYIHKINGLC